MQRSPKWQRMYSGPFLVIRKINDVNYVVQKSRRSEAMVVHVDKLKTCVDQNRDNWLATAVRVEAEAAENNSGGPIDRSVVPALARRRRHPLAKPVVEDGSEDEEMTVRPKRQAGKPRRFDDFV